MSKPVNILSLRFKPNTTLKRGWQLYVDQRSLLDMLEQAVKTPTGHHWREKKQARVLEKALAASLTSPGEHPILICAHCAALGHISSGDLLLSDVRVTHEGDYIGWEIDPPGLQLSNDTLEPLRFRFHRPQYAAAIAQMQAESTPG